MAPAEMSLHLSLETRGTMDLIKILSIDAAHSPSSENLRASNDMKLRVQGRLLPVSLDLAAWPTSASRPRAAISYWIASTLKLPSSATFILPVLFFQWNDQLPTATPNALILESTKEPGVFRRGGTARLHPNICLNKIFGQLYAINMDSEPATEMHPWGEEATQASSNPTPGVSPEQDLSDARQASVAARHLDDGVDRVRRMLINRSNKPVKGYSAATLQKYITAARRVNEHAIQSSYLQSSVRCYRVLEHEHPNQ
jgi:hypothetical protein